MHSRTVPVCSFSTAFYDAQFSGGFATRVDNDPNSFDLHLFTKTKTTTTKDERKEANSCSLVVNNSLNTHHTDLTDELKQTNQLTPLRTITNIKNHSINIPTPVITIPE